MAPKFTFTPLKSGIVSVRTGGQPEPHITVLWRHALESKPDFPDQSGVYVLADLIPGKTANSRFMWADRLNLSSTNASISTALRLILIFQDG